MDWTPFEYFKNAQARDYESFLRGAEAYQEWLAKQCGEKPCADCPFVHHQPGCQVICYDLGKWEGQQQGYARAMLERE